MADQPIHLGNIDEILRVRAALPLNRKNPCAKMRTVGLGG
jgi:hypothetical protein